MRTSVYENGVVRERKMCKDKWRKKPTTISPHHDVVKWFEHSVSVIILVRVFFFLHLWYFFSFSLLHAIHPFDYSKYMFHLLLGGVVWRIQMLSLTLCTAIGSWLSNFNMSHKHSRMAATTISQSKDAVAPHSVIATTIAHRHFYDIRCAT